jgi:hypothetical protein
MTGICTLTNRKTYKGIDWHKHTDDELEDIILIRWQHCPNWSIDSRESTLESCLISL